LSQKCLQKDCNVCAKAESTTTDTIKLASFNIQVFGRSKAAKAEVMEILAETIAQYDVIAIQEIRDKSRTADGRYSEGQGEGRQIRQKKETVQTAEGRTTQSAAARRADQGFDGRLWTIEGVSISLSRQNDMMRSLNFSPQIK
jgi:endonuclease/exonuclease/phosphatase family metal-dependent hydrolase